jgi:hypothetical protein
MSKIPSFIRSLQKFCALTVRNKDIPQEDINILLSSPNSEAKKKKAERATISELHT